MLQTNARCLLLAWLHGVASVTPSGEAHGWPASLAFLDSGGDADFFELVVPLSNMTRFTYTSTWGSYYKTADANATHPGWLRGTSESNPRDGGMRALVFVQPSASRGVIAFRGTDLNRSTVSGHADSCADAVLLGSLVPDDCSVFSQERVDYLSRALDFADEAAARNPGTDWLFTGHSLGALLAETVAAVRGSPAVTFSAPPVLPVLRNRTAVPPSSVGRWAVAALYAQYDPLRYLSQHQLPGAVCTWPAADAPPGCQACEQGDKEVDLDRPECKQCFYETHVFKNYLDLVLSRMRPRCGPAADLPTWVALV